MIEWLPPFLIVFLGALAVWKLPRSYGFGLGALSLFFVGLVAAVLPFDIYHSYSVFGVFDVALFRLDEFTSLIGITFSILGLAGVLYGYSSGLSRKEGSAALFYVGSTFGVVFAGDWLTALFFLELMAVTSTVLVWLKDGEAVRAGYRYALAHGLAGTLLFMGVAGHFVIADSLLLTETGIVGGWPSVLMLLGIGINCGFIGLHFWLPDTYPKPHFAASVFLSVFTTKTSAYVLFRIFPEGSLALIVAYMGGFMAVYGVFFALLQHDMRALLSYHIQAQMGYMIAGIGIGIYLGGESLAVGVGGATAHLVNNILFKALLFMAVGVIIYRTGINDLYELGGLYKVMPLTFIAFLFGALSITAIPGFNGFISKGLILDAANPSYFGGGNIVLYWLLMVGAVGTFLSFIKLGYYAFFHNKSEIDVKDANHLQSVSMIFIGVLCLAMGVGWKSFVEVLPVVSLELGVEPYSASHLKDALGLALVSLVVFKIIRKPLSNAGLNDPAKKLYGFVFKSSVFTVSVFTSLYRSVDILASRIVEKMYGIGNSPESFARYISEILPEKFSREFLGVHPKEKSKLDLRAGISGGLLLILIVLIIFLSLI